MCGCRKPKQVEELAEAVKVKLSATEILKLETAADRANAKIMGPDLFRMFVKKNKIKPKKDKFEKIKNKNKNRKIRPRRL